MQMFVQNVIISLVTAKAEFSAYHKLIRGISSLSVMGFFSFIAILQGTQILA